MFYIGFKDENYAQIGMARFAARWHNRLGAAAEQSDPQTQSRLMGRQRLLQTVGDLRRHSLAALVQRPP